MEDFMVFDSSSDDDSACEDEMVLLMMLQDESDDERLLSKGPTRGGSMPGKSPNKERRRHVFHDILMSDYWGVNPTNNVEDFRRRFRMPIGLFDEIVIKIQQFDSYFVRKRDACHVVGLSPLKRWRRLFVCLPPV